MPADRHFAALGRAVPRAQARAHVWAHLRAHVGALALTVALAGVLVTGCTSSSAAKPAGASPAAAGNTASAGRSASAGSARAASSSVSATATTTPGTARPTTAPSTTRAPAGASTATATHKPLCAGTALAVTALPGSGAMGVQYATVRVTNRGTAACWLVGYASARLEAGGHPLGLAAKPIRGGVPALFLADGHSATAALEGPSTCNAPLSDQVLVTAPRQVRPTRITLTMRGCPLVIDPFRRG